MAPLVQVSVSQVAACTIRSAFEYQGQKCSANSRAYIPKSLWPAVKAKLQAHQEKLKLASVSPSLTPSQPHSLWLPWMKLQPLETDTFLTAVIDEKSFDRINGYLQHAQSSPNLSIVAGGKADKSEGYFVAPTIVESKDPMDK